MGVKFQDYRHMSKEKKLIPEFRFVEFSNYGEWEANKIENLFHLQDGYSFASSDFTTNPENSKQVIRITDINNQNKNLGKVYITEAKIRMLSIEAFKVKKGDLLLSLTGAGGFNFFVWNGDEAFINQRTMKITPKSSDNDDLKFLLEPIIYSEINLIGTGQNNNLSKDALKDLEVYYPKPLEQKKIALFITSLNNLIESNIDKLNTLIEHRKGLIQNLFPGENQSVPNFRFPEFKSEGDWKKVPIGDVITENSRPIKMLDHKEYSCVNVKRRYGGVVSRGHYKGETIKVKTQFVIEDGDFLISKRQIVHCACGIVPPEFKGSIVSNEYSVLVPKGENNISFINYFAQQKVVANSFLKCSIGVVIEKMLFKLEEWLKMEFYFPSPKEQNKIAIFLSELDELISSQYAKIDELQQHKKGLLKITFPHHI
jgi:type I restriction enzyme S subunit